MCRVSAASVKKVDPTATKIVITEERSRDWEIPEVEEIISMPGTPWTHLTKISHLTRFVLTHPDWEILSIDSDTLVLKPFPFPETDLWLTWRRFIKNMKDLSTKGDVGTHTYNGGVWGLRCSRNGHEIMIWMRERLRRMSESNREWWGDQSALYELAGPPPLEGGGSEVHKVRFPIDGVIDGDHISIAKIPCEEWNYSPTKKDEDVISKGILHFKGGSREFFPEYAQRLGL